VENNFYKIKKMEKELAKTKWGIDHAHSEIGFGEKHEKMVWMLRTHLKRSYCLPEKRIQIYPLNLLNHLNLICITRCLICLLVKAFLA